MRKAKAAAEKARRDAEELVQRVEAASRAQVKILQTKLGDLLEIKNKELEKMQQDLHERSEYVEKMKEQMAKYENEENEEAFEISDKEPTTPRESKQQLIIARESNKESPLPTQANPDSISAREATDSASEEEKTPALTNDDLNAKEPIQESKESVIIINRSQAQVL